MDTSEIVFFKQHLIDPQACIRCNTCESVCPNEAISHDINNYVVDASRCNLCLTCVPSCPTGSIDNWREVPKTRAYSIEEQFGWGALPQPLSEAKMVESTDRDDTPQLHSPTEADASSGEESGTTALRSGDLGSVLPPWSAAFPYTNLYGPKASTKLILATVTGNTRVTETGNGCDIHHIVLDFGGLPFPVLEGQSIAVIAPGQDERGKPYSPRQYSIASSRDGERPRSNNVSLTIKRVLEDPQGRSGRGVASNYMCDLKVGDKVSAIGPFGKHFLMPNHPGSHIVMICTGTGIAPMRAMIEWRWRLRKSGKFEGGRLMLFFGARTPEELPYFASLQQLPKDFVDLNLAFSRVPGQAKRYVQDVMLDRAFELAQLLQDQNAYFYVCGLKAMEEGVVLALRDVAQRAGLDWERLGSALKVGGRLHLETY